MHNVVMQPMFVLLHASSRSHAPQANDFTNGIYFLQDDNHMRLSGLSALGHGRACIHSLSGRLIGLSITRMAFLAVGRQLGIMKQTVTYYCIRYLDLSSVGRLADIIVYGDTVSCIQPGLVLERPPNKRI